jgi:uncharacterized protein YceH (UPF0502 family)
LTHEFSAEEAALLCVLMLRGAQTVGELRARSERLCKFDSLGQVEDILSRLISRQDGPYVVKLARQPGRREARYVHLLCGDVEPGIEEAAEATHSAAAPSDSARDKDRIAALERAMDELRGELEAIKRRLEQ